ncbi:MAG: hypothetical protein AB7F22_35680 [Reyranella sp.]|uniref:hypothetical protein n=1 Tax=Reyranella sp. TaxID=1929291 RepID=UPI003D0A2B61
MAKSIKVKPKKRGRPATGKDPLIGARFPPALIEAIDAWSAASEQPMTRSEAIRRLVEQGFRIPALYLGDMLRIAKGSGTTAHKVVEAKKRSDFYIEMAMKFYNGEVERVESDVQTLGDSLMFTGEPESVIRVLEPVRQYLKQKAEELRLKAKGAKR